MPHPTRLQRPKRKIKGIRKIALLIAFFISLVVPLLLSGVGFFLSVWVVLPAPTLWLLPLGVGAPEVSPWLIGINAIALLLTLWFLPKGWLYGLALSLSAIALLLSSLPLIQFPAANARFAAEIQSVLGANYLTQIPAKAQTQLRPHPFILLDAFRGIPTQNLRVSKGIPFATPADATLTLNLYRPLQPGQYPAIVVIYGGAWKNGTPDNDEPFSRYMAARGYTVVAIDYRHAPRYRFPAQLEDVQTALRYIQQHAEDLEVDRDRVALMGRSAGAHLAMLAAFQPSSLPIRALVNYYGPVDLTKGYFDLPTPDPIDSRSILRAFLGGTPNDLPERYRLASPITYVTQPQPPSLLVYAGRDHLVQAKFGRGLYEQLRATGSQTALLEIPWAEHAFDAVFNGVSNQLALYYTERFLAWSLKR